MTTFHRLAIVNRGEPAMRLIHAARELGQDEGWDLTTLALFTEPDHRAMFVREADEAFALGSATFTDPRDGGVKNRYLDYATLERVLREARADAVWVGWGFVAEHADFADLCRRLGIVFIGPSGDVMRRLGDKISSKKLAEAADVPVAPWSGGPVDSLKEARTTAKKLGYPLMIKATAGGGGRGIRKVEEASQLEEAFESARAEALKAFGDPTVFFERLVEAARHVEVQVVADGQGTAWALGVRDCTLQRRHQKVLEETPSPVLSAEQDARLRAAATRLVLEAGYENAGTVEFLYAPRDRSFAFMEVNARLQVEHPVTELVTGADLVKLQLHVAGGGTLEGEPPPSRGHAIEVRLNAEDPASGFAPAPGEVELLRLPTGPGLRIDTGIEEGDRIAADFDSMVAKIMAVGRDRAEALARLRRALRDTAVVVRGGATNKGFLVEMLSRPEIESGDIDVAWLDRLTARREHVSSRGAEVALLAAALEAYQAEADAELTGFFASAVRGRTRVSSGVGRQVALEVAGRRFRLHVHRLDAQRFRVEHGGRWIDLQIEHLGSWERRLAIGQGLERRRHRVLVAAQGLTYLVEVDGSAHRVSRDDGGTVRASAPAVVASIHVEPGQEVEVGDRLVVLEAMKMETSVVARFPGVVQEVLVRSNVQVPPGTALVRIAPRGDGDTPIAGDDPAAALASLPAATLADRPQPTAAANLDQLRCLFLGFDIGPGHLRWLMRSRAELRRRTPLGDPAMRRGEDELLGIFVDLLALFDCQPDEEELDAGIRLSSQRAFLTYLRDPDGQGEGLPTGFVGKLRRALAHYGLEGADTLERTPRLDAALYRIHRAHQRLGELVAPVLDILERRLEVADSVGHGDADEDFRRLLDRLVAESGVHLPAIHDSAREVRYRYFTEPFWQKARAAVYRRAEDDLEALVDGLGEEERAGRVAALVESPQPLESFLSRRFSTAEPQQRCTMLEILLRRYYRIRELQNIRCFRLDDGAGRAFAAAEYPYEGRRIHALLTHGEYAHLADAFGDVARVLERIPDAQDVIIDLYVWRDSPLGTIESSREELATSLERFHAAAGFGRRLRRLVVALSGPEAGLGMGDVQHFTFRSRPPEDVAGFTEDLIYRDLHPMTSKRLRLWRLSDFDVERLETAEEDVHLFRGQARSNPKDERLFAFADVRDLTPLRGDGGEIVRLPHLEHRVIAALGGIRRFQSHRGPRKRLHWNRLFLFIWPDFDLAPDDIGALARRLAPEAEGLGLEKILLYTRRAGAEDTVLELTDLDGEHPAIQASTPSGEPIRGLDAYEQSVLRLRQRGLVHPYELLRRLTPDASTHSDLPPGSFVEHDLDENHRLVPVERPPGQNTANIVVGLISNRTAKYPEGMERVILIGDPSRAMGSLAEPECRRIIAGLELAHEHRLPVEWFAVSAGAKIAMDSGTENMDWISRVLRCLVVLTQQGLEVNIIVTGINVGAQPYWNAEATMLMHTRGILIETAQGAMVLTGKQALDYSGGVSADDNFGIGGYERIMGPNGQAQYFARDVGEACRILLHHYEHTYVVPGERFPRRARALDPPDRDVRPSLHGELGLATVGDVFSPITNPGRKKPFSIRRIMHAVIDSDHEPLERWRDVQGGEIAVVWDAHLGGHPVCLLGLESQPVPRLGFVPADGPDQWTAGTLFPLSSKKVARTLNSASGNRPVVILANLSGFDGSPESMRELQLEFGAEIGRAVVNFDGPMIFLVVSRYHGGAFVVFSGALSEDLEVAALEHTHASVIGGAPAAAVVFARDVKKRTQNDPRIRQLEERLAAAKGAETVRLQAELRELTAAVHSEHLGQVAEEFDAIHSVQRAQEVGSVHHIIPPERTRPYLIEAVERGMARHRAVGEELAAI